MAVFVFVNVIHELRVSNDLEGQSGIAAALAPSGGAADGVPVDQQGRGEALQISGKVNGGRRLADAAFMACDRDYHLFVYSKFRLCIYTDIQIYANTRFCICEFPYIRLHG